MSDINDLLETLEEKLNRTMENISNEGIENIKNHLQFIAPQLQNTDNDLYNQGDN